MLDKITVFLHHFSFNRIKQQAFLEDASSLISDGVPAQQAIATIHKISTGVEKEVSESILHALSEGKQIADGMTEWFPQHIVALIRTGEDGGTLPTTMHTAAVALSQSVSVFSSLMSSLIYPLVVLLLACLVSIFLKHSIFTNFEAIKPVSSWPAIGQTFLFFANFVEKWWWLVFIFIIGFIVFITQVFKLYVGDMRSFLDDFPPFSIYRSFVAAQFMEILGLLINNGITFKTALSIIQNKATKYIIWHVYMMQIRLGSGRENIAEVLDTGLISEENITRLKVIAQGKGFEHALIRLGDHAVRKSAREIELIGRILGGCLLAVDAAVAIFMILSVYSVGTFIGGGGG